MSVFATVARKSLNGKFSAKIDFPIRAFYVAITDSDVGSLKSLRTLFDKYLDHILVKFEHNRMVGNVQNWSFLAKYG